MYYAALKHSDYDHSTDEEAFSDAGTVETTVGVQRKYF